MPNPSLPDKWSGIYDKFYNLAEDLSVKFDITKAGLSPQGNAIERIFDVVDDVYVESIDIGLAYQEAQVLAAIAVIEASEFKGAEEVSPGDRSFDG